MGYIYHILIYIYIYCIYNQQRATWDLGVSDSSDSGATARKPLDLHMPYEKKGLPNYISLLIITSNCISHRIHGAGIYANINGVYWWDPCYHI